MMDALTGAYPRAMGDDGFLHTAPSVGPMRGVETGGEGTAAGAIHAAFHIAAALVQRARTGEGAYIDISGAEGVISQAWIAATYALNEQRIADRSTMPAAKDGEMTGSTYQFYECADGQNILFCCIEPKFWKNFCAAIDRPDLLDGNRASGGAEVDFGVGRDDLRRELQSIFATKPLEEWVAIAAGHDIAMGPAYRSVVDAAEDPHLTARGPSTPTSTRSPGRTPSSRRPACCRPAVPHPSPRAGTRRSQPRDPRRARFRRARDRGAPRCRSGGRRVSSA